MSEDDYLPGPLGVMQRKIEERVARVLTGHRHDLVAHDHPLGEHEHGDLAERVDGHTLSLAAVDDRLAELERRLTGHSHEAPKPASKPRPSRAKAAKPAEKSAKGAK
jgi:hypothetical protein